jgi:hypothetical protein
MSFSRVRDSNACFARATVLKILLAVLVSLVPASRSWRKPRRAVCGPIAVHFSRGPRLCVFLIRALRMPWARGILERFREEHGDKRIAAIERKHVQALIDAKASTP